LNYWNVVTIQDPQTLGEIRFTGKASGDNRESKFLNNSASNLGLDVVMT